MKTAIVRRNDQSIAFEGVFRDETSDAAINAYFNEKCDRNGIQTYDITIAPSLPVPHIQF